MCTFIPCNLTKLNHFALQMSIENFVATDTLSFQLSLIWQLFRHTTRPVDLGTVRDKVCFNWLNLWSTCPFNGAHGVLNICVINSSNASRQRMWPCAICYTSFREGMVIVTNCYRHGSASWSVTCEGYIQHIGWGIESRYSLEDKSIQLARRNFLL